MHPRVGSPLRPGPIGTGEYVKSLQQVVLKSISCVSIVELNRNAKAIDGAEHVLTSYQLNSHPSEDLPFGWLGTRNPRVWLNRVHVVRYSNSVSPLRRKCTDLWETRAAPPAPEAV